MIRLTVPSIEEDDLFAVRETLASGRLVQGERVQQFEKEVADQFGLTHCLAVANCTCALHLALLALDVKPGDVCVVAAYSWISTANAVELCGARPVFVDIDPRTFNMDVSQLELALRKLMSDPDSASRVKAVIPVDTFGQMADMQSISELSARWNIPIVEDAACALGATQHGRQATSLSSIGCFSFHPRKAITTGEGGMLVTGDDALARRLRALRNHGQEPGPDGHADFVMPGHNYRLTEFQAAMGVTQMKKMRRIVEARKKAAAIYDELLEGTLLTRPYVMEGASHVYQSYVTLLPAAAASERSRLIKDARARGVEAQIGTIHMPLTTFYKKKYGYRLGDFPVTDDVSARALTLPLYETISVQDQRSVVDVVLSLLD